MIYTYMLTCVHIYIYMYMYTYIHTYIHMYMYIYFFYRGSVESFASWCLSLAP